ncbi:hypothetical protein ACP4OV_017836 [Aristida adscensionis]
MVNGSGEKKHGIDECLSTSEVLENKLRQNFRLGDVTWVKHNGSSWWPAQVIDEACAGSKPKKKTKHDCLVRLYGTCQYLYVDPWKSDTEFKMMLKQENKTAMEVFRELLEKDISHINSSSDFEEEAVNSEDEGTKLTTPKATSRKAKKRESSEQRSYRVGKEPATAKNLGMETEQDQEAGSTARTGAAARKGKRQYARQSSPSNDEEQDTDGASSENSSEGLRNKRQKQAANVLGKKGCRMRAVGTSVSGREGLRRSGRTNTKESDDRTGQLTDTRASKYATEGSTVDGTSAPHAEIKAMVRDILFEDIIDKEHEAEMAYVDEVINGICNAAENNATDGATSAAKVGQGVKPSGSRSSNATQGNGNGKPNEVTPSRGAMKEPGQLSARQIRQIRIMQSLGLIAPSGSPFGKTGVFAAPHR